MNTTGIILLSDRNAAEELKKPGVLVIEAGREKCDDCEKMRPAFERAVRRFAGARFAQLNVRLDPMTAKYLGASFVPAIFILRDGIVMSMFVGWDDENYMLDCLRLAFRGTGGVTEVK